MGMQSIVATGGNFATTGNSGPQNWPPGYRDFDICVVPVQTAGESVAAFGVFVEGPSSPQSTGTGGQQNSDRITHFWARAAGAMAAFTVPDGGNHIIGRPFLVRGCIQTGTPIVASAGNVVAFASATDIIALPSIDTTGHANCLIVGIHAHGLETSVQMYIDAQWVNAALANITEHIDYSSTAGVGGGIGVMSGQKATAGVVGVTAGKLANAASQAFVTLAFKGEPTGAPAAPASEDQCGAECGIGDPGPVTVPDKRHWQNRGGAIPTAQTAIARHGGRAYRFTPVNDVSWLGRNCSDPARVKRKYFYFASLPTTDAELIRCLVNAGTEPQLLYRQATQDAVARIGGQLTGSYPVVPGVFYRFEVAADLSANPRTMKFTAAIEDGSGTDLGTASLAEAPSVITSWRYGASCLTPTTADVIVDDMRWGALASAYPFGPEWIIGIQTPADGSHAFNVAGDFKYDNLSNIPTDPEGLSHEYLLGLLNSGASWLSAVGATPTTEYLEWTVGGMVAVASISGVSVVALLRGADASAHGQTLQLKDGATVVDVYAGSSFPGTTPSHFSRHYLTKPSGGAWTQAALNALLIHWFRTSGLPGIAGLMLEVGYVPSGGFPASSGSTQQHPLHVYASAGTRNVRLTVTDEDGLEGTVLKAVVVP